MNVTILAIFSKIAAFFKKISLRTWIEIILGVALILGLTFLWLSYKSAKSSLATAENNNAAFMAELNDASNQIIQYEFNMEQMRYFNDSISKKLVAAVDNNKIKDKKIKELQYMLSHFERRDTIRLMDTIFCEPEFIFDTSIGDKWMCTDLHLEYPATIGVKSTATSEKTVIISSKRETINPPKKCAIARWFQKKHTVIEVIVDEQNPYIVSDTNRFVQITK